MDNLHGLVRKVAMAVWAALAAALALITDLTGHVLGNVSWQAPAWGRYLSVKMAPLGARLAAHAAWVVLAVLTAAAGAAAAHHLKATGRGILLSPSYWLHQISAPGVQPDRPAVSTAAIQVLPPERTPVEGDAKPRPVAFNFSMAVAPLARVGKEALDIELAPALPGRWLWVSASRLEFTPTEDWPIGSTYKVKFGAKTVAPHINMERSLSFDSPRFELRVGEGSFYQDPVQLNLRKVVFEVNFSHPVKPESFEQHLELAEGDGARSLFGSAATKKFTVTYDKYRINATVHSEALSIPQQTAALRLRITPGVSAQRGGVAADHDFTRSVAVPGLYSLDVLQLKQMIVTGETGEPENMLQVTTGMGVHEKEISRMVSAWLLPATKPATGGEQDSSAWSDPKDVSDEVLKSAQSITLAPVPTEREVNENHTFKFRAEPGRYLLVRVKKGLKSAGGYQLGANRDEIVRIQRSAPELSLMSRGSVLALSGEKKLPLVVRDLPGVRLEIGRLMPQQLQHLVTQSQGDFTRPEFYYGITPDNLTERFEKKVELKLRPGKTHYEAIDFAEYLRSDASDRRGVFLLTVQGYDPNSNAPQAREYQPGTRAEGDSEYEGDGEEAAMERDPGEAIDPATLRDRRLVIVTDLGIVAKQAVDGSRDVFVQSVANGQPVAAAGVEIWGRNGTVLASQTTDAEGRARLPSVSGFVREKAPVVLVVRKSGDLAFLPLNRSDRALDLSRFDVGGLRNSTLPNQIQAYVFSDRGIYRPGDTINIGIVAKASDWSKRLADLPVEAEVVDARGLIVRRETLKLGAGGMAEFSHATQDSSPTGNYAINLNLARDSASAAPGTQETPPLRLGSVSVKVQEFLPDRMKVSARLSSESDEGWVSPNDLKGRVNVQNLFGTPAPKRRVEAELTLVPGYPAFRSHPDFVFSDPAQARERFHDTLETSQTDADGNVELALGLQRYGNATYRLHLLARAFEPEGGRSVAAEAGTLVSDRPYLIGYKADGDLSYINRNAARQLSLIAINPKSKKVAVGNLKLVRIERKVLSVLVKQPNGLYKYESRNKETVLDETPLSLSAGTNSVVLATQSPGNFAYLVKDAEGLELARAAYSVAGSGNVTRSLDRNAELQLTLNKKDYNPGEEIQLSVRAPYAGVGLITIERDKVYAHKWFSAGTTASVQKISLPADFEGNGYVSVQFARDLASDEIFMSPMSYGIAPFATSLARRTAPLDLTVPDVVKPGQTITMHLESKLPARAIVFAVDEGILQVARYENPDPLKFFFRKRALEVRTQQTLDLLLPEFKKLMNAAAPGGDAESMLGKNLNPFKRKRDKPVAYWSGVVELAGAKDLSYTVPENFNGALRVIAIAVNEETANAASATTTVRGDLVLLPNVPVAITPGDEVEVGIGVANNTAGSGKNAPVELNLTVSPGLEVVGPAQQKLSISERSEGSTKFRLRAKDGKEAQLGSASVVFSARVSGASARLGTDVSVRPASPYVTLVQSGLFRGNGEITAQGDMYAQLARSEVALSTSPWGFTAGLVQYLDVYPHGCTEQITSQIFPAVILSSQAGLAEQLFKRARTASGKDDALNAPPLNARKSLERYLALVRARQTADGGFSMWPGGSSDLFATTYVTGLLLEARERKLPVPNDLLQRANTYLQLRLAEAPNWDYDWRLRSEAAYQLTRQGIVTTAALSNLRDYQHQRMTSAGSERERAAWRDDLGAAYLAASYQILKQEAIADELLTPVFANAMAKPKADYWKDWYWAYYYDPLIAQSGVVTLVARHFPKRIGLVPEDYWRRMADVIGRGYFQSHSAAEIMKAVDAYAQAASKSVAGKISVGAVGAAGTLQPINLPPIFLLAKAAVPSGTVKLKLDNQGDLPAFYSWAESGFERNLPQQAVAQGMEIVREFLDARGSVITQAQLGEEITVRVRVRATESHALQQVALVDLLPGGMEPVLNSPSDSDEPNTPLWKRRLGGQGTWNIDYADLREDRVVFYGNVDSSMTEVTYKVRATNVGDFKVPAAYGEAMYDRRVFARSAAGSFRILPAAQ
ncbi:MAG: hypothetical protein KF778_10615 [Rhodocyclaceae bacterium]|nr:hypothetical protein [Rhodocyclaceae bacterium]